MLTLKISCRVKSFAEDYTRNWFYLKKRADLKSQSKKKNIRGDKILWVGLNNIDKNSFKHLYELAVIYCQFLIKLIRTQKSVCRIQKCVKLAVLSQEQASNDTSILQQKKEWIMEYH